MRTNLTLDPDVTQMLAETAHRQYQTVEQVVNDATRWRGWRGLMSVVAASSIEQRWVRPISALLVSQGSAGTNPLAYDV